MFIDIMSETKAQMKEAGLNPGQQEKPDQENYQDFPLQFTVGIVTSAITNPMSDGFKEERDMGGVLAIKNSTFKRQGSRDLTMFQTQGDLYLPLLRGIQDIPTQGDPVLLCKFEGVGYYLGPLNAFGNPNFNPDVGLPKPMSGASSLRSQLMINPEFEWNPEYKRLYKPVITELDEPGGLPTKNPEMLGTFGVGDLMLEGRYGNSIRIGQRGKDPLVMISNGRRMNNTTETLNDGSTIFMGKNGTMSQHWRKQFQLYSNRIELENNRPLVFEDRSRHQLYLDSDTIIFNAKGDGGTEENELNEGIIMSSYSNIRFGAGNSFELSTKHSTLIDSHNIYFGRGAMEDHINEKKDSLQPMVLGDELRKFLLEIINLLEGFQVTGCIAGMSGPPSPTVINTLLDLKERLNKAGESEFESVYHFIEANNTEK